MFIEDWRNRDKNEIKIKDCLSFHLLYVYITLFNTTTATTKASVFNYNVYNTVFFFFALFLLIINKHRYHRRNRYQRYECCRLRQK